MKSSLKNKSNLSQRILAGLAGAAIMVSLLVINEWTFLFLIGCLCIFALQEFYKILNASDVKTNRWYGTIIGIVVFTVVFLIEKELIHLRSYYLFFPFFFFLFIIELFLKNEKPFQNIAYTFLGVIYIVFPLSLLNVPAFIEGEYTYKYILSVIIMIWANDTGAYIAGRALGKRKLFQRISPKKTWEGTIGGALLAVAVAVGASYLFTGISIINWILLALIIVVFGSLGDLVESMFKRSLDIKDSGGMIPGHGGFLDRFDSLLIAAPFIAAFFKIIF
ncbi:MAG: phosphatidate cytidylyltransferase [Cytophagaceae bacterium]